MDYIDRGTYDDGRHFLVIVDCPDEVAALFEDRGLQGGGYTWLALLPVLARLAEPPISGPFDIDAEMDNAHIDSTDLDLLDAFEAVIRRGMTDLALLQRCLDEADPDVLE